MFYRGLSLGRLFAKPRPIWAAESTIGLFGDAFIEGKMESSGSILPWSYIVFNHTFQRMLSEQQEYLKGALFAIAR